ncbi:unnamed protein product, partial [Symbiodinium microadriaticum]
MEVHVKDLTELTTAPDGSVNGLRSSWSYLRLSDLWNPVADGVTIVDGRRSYELLKERYHELMIGLLHLTAFEIIELWLVDDSRADRMIVVAAFHTDACLQPWAAFTRLLSLSSGIDIPGLVLQRCRPVVDQGYGDHNQFDIMYPRALHANGLGITTALGVPLPSGGRESVSGTLVLYSRQAISIDPAMLTMITAAAYLLAGSVDPPVRLAIQEEAETADSVFRLCAPKGLMGVDEVESAVTGGHKEESSVGAVTESFVLPEMEPSYEEDSKCLIDYALQTALEFFGTDFDSSWTGDGMEEQVEGEPLAEPISFFADG